jgi:hypothetical protein
MIFFIFFYFNFFIFLNSYLINYNGVIELTIKPDPSMIKEDLLIVSNYKKEVGVEKKLSVPMITVINNDSEKNGLALYEQKKNPYEDLHYQVAKKLLETHMQGIEGIVAHYRGYTVTSDQNGTIAFPRLDDSKSISIIITEKIYPIVLHGSVPDHFIIDQSYDYKAYIAKSIINIEENNLKWIIEDDNVNIKDRIIPFQAIIIFGNPHKFFFDKIPLLLENSINIILPSIYLMEDSSINNYINLAIETLQYFKPFSQNRYQVTIEDQLHEGTTLK